MSTFNGMDMGDGEWRGSLFTRYWIDPPELHHCCNGWKMKFSINNALKCKKVFLITTQNNQIRDGVANNSIKDFTPSHLHENILIYTGHATQGMRTRPSGHHQGNPETTKKPPLVLEDPENKIYLLSRYFWQKIIGSIANVHAVDSDEYFYLKSTPEKCLQVDKKEKKQKYLQACLQQYQNLSRFIFSMNGLLGAEAEAMLKRIVSHLA